MIRLITISLGGDVFYYIIRLIYVLWEMSLDIQNGLTFQDKVIIGATLIV